MTPPRDAQRHAEYYSALMLHLNDKDVATAALVAYIQADALRQMTDDEPPPHTRPKLER